MEMQPYRKASEIEVLDGRQVADILGVSVNTAARYMKNQTIPAVKLGGRWVTTTSQLEESLKARQLSRPTDPSNEIDRRSGVLPSRDACQ